MELDRANALEDSGGEIPWSCGLTWMIILSRKDAG